MLTSVQKRISPLPYHDPMRARSVDHGQVNRGTDVQERYHVLQPRVVSYPHHIPVIWIRRGQHQAGHYQGNPFLSCFHLVQAIYEYETICCFSAITCLEDKTL